MKSICCICFDVIHKLELKFRLKVKLSYCAGCIARTVNSPNQHLLRAEDVVSCCLDLSVPSISFRINGQPVQGMFENFNSDGLFFPVASFSAGVKSVLHTKQNSVPVCAPHVRGSFSVVCLPIKHITIDVSKRWYSKCRQKVEFYLICLIISRKIFD